MIRSPVLRISAGLVMLTISALMFGELLGVVPDTRSAEIESRKVIAESLAVQVSTTIGATSNEESLRMIRSVVSRNDSVISVGVRHANGKLLIQAGNHEAQWTAPDSESSTPTHVLVPLFAGDKPWGTVEVQFQPLGFGTSLFQGSFLSLLLFTAAAGFAAYFLFLKRVLRELNPDAVIPERVRTALDTLAEGVLVVDAREQIVFANQAFAAKIGVEAASILGKPVAHFNWTLADGEELPWKTLLRGDATPGPVEAELTAAGGERYALVINASPISAGTGQQIRGVMATFDDVTELEKANDELRHALTRLENNEKEIRRQNQELQVLATRDPLTGCLNRRSLFKGFDTLIAEARIGDTELSCIMVDIDHFKSINDRFGHATGDRVIRELAELLLEFAGADDLVGRYGGEEFCLVTPGRDAAGAAAHAERLRGALCAGRGEVDDKHIAFTCSFGVSQLAGGRIGQKELMDQADQALYAAKTAGRNRVIMYDAARRPDPMPIEASPPAIAAVEPTSDEVATLQRRVQSLQEALAEREENGIVDQVTGMPGRLLLLDRATQAIERAKRYRHHVVSMSLALDGLSRVRDALGEVAAEQFREIAIDRIKKIFRASDSIALLGGNETGLSVARLGTEQIGILLTDVENLDRVPGIVGRLQNAILKPQEIAGNEVSLSADIGISVYPNDCLDAVTMLRHASAAMHELGREAGRNRSRFYSAEINKRSKRRLQLESELNRAIELDEFRVHYQPKVNIQTGEITGAEALLRWNNPRIGIVPPDEFIGVAEQMGCIGRISDMTIAKVCKQIAHWRDSGIGEVPVAVNLSPVEFQESRLVNRLVRRIGEAEIKPGLLEVEITESVLMESQDIALENMQRISAAGMSIAIDDFGTGYSTLRCLNRFPVSKIKIDRSFLINLMDQERDAALVTGVIALAHSMGLVVVAEGIETAEQLAYLRDLRCDEGQGYFLAKPVPRDEVTELLANPLQMSSLVAGSVSDDGMPCASQLISVLSEINGRV